MDYENGPEWGASVIELLVSVSIIWIIAGMAIPALRGYSEGGNLGLAASQTMSALRLAQSKSLAGIEHGISFDDARESFYLVRRSDGRRIEKYGLPSEIRIKSNFPNGRVFFNRWGAPSRGGTVTLSYQSGSEMGVTVMLNTGRVRIR